MNWHGKRVLVTGAGGFIGSHLAEALIRAGARVRAMVHYNARDGRGHLDALDPPLAGEVEFFAGDLLDRTRTREAVEGCELVFHLGALIAIPYSYRAVESYLATNVQGTFNVLEACRECRVERLVHTSTSEVYGSAQYTPIDERHPLHAQSPYAASKIAADQLAGSYHAAFGLPVVIVRPFNNFGPRQSARAVIPTIISQALVGDRVELGATDPVRDFLFVADSARGFMAAAAAKDIVGETFNLATGRGVSIGEVVEIVGTNLGRTLEIRASQSRTRPAASEVVRLIGSAEKAAQRLDWRPTTSLEAGLEQAIRWIAAHPGDYRPRQYTV